MKQLSSINIKRFQICCFMLLVGALVSGVVQAQAIELPAGDVSFRVLDTRKALSFAIRARKELTVSSFQLQSPPRIVVDIAKEIPALPGMVPLSFESVEQVRIGRHPGKTRFVFDLKPGVFPYPGSDEAVTEQGRQFKLAFQKKVAVTPKAAEEKTLLEVKPEKQLNKGSKQPAQKTKAIARKGREAKSEQSLKQDKNKEKVALAIDTPPVKKQPTKKAPPPARVKEAVVKKTIVEKRSVPEQVQKVSPKTPVNREKSVTVASGVLLEDLSPESIAAPQIEIDRKAVRDATPPVAEQTRNPTAEAVPLEVDQKLERLAPEIVPGIKLELPAEEPGESQKTAALAIGDQQPAVEIPTETETSEKGVAESLVNQMEEDPEVEPFHAPDAVQAVFADEGIALDAIDYALLCGMGSLLVLLLLYRRRTQPSPMLRMSEMQQLEEEKLDVDSYSILGCTRDDSNQEIKERYKQLLKIYHRDGLEAQDIPEEVRKLSDDKLRKVQQAYERVRMERGF